MRTEQRTYSPEIIGIIDAEEVNYLRKTGFLNDEVVALLMQYNILGRNGKPNVVIPITREVKDFFDLWYQVNNNPMMQTATRLKC